MFETTQPSPDQSQNDWSNQELGNSQPEFASIVEFSEWIDEQLSILESKHQEFFTVKSLRSFLNRG